MRLHISYSHVFLVEPYYKLNFLINFWEFLNSSRKQIQKNGRRSSYLLIAVLLIKSVKEGVSKWKKFSF